MYHNPYDIANVLSLESIKGKHRVTYDSWDRDGVFKVHTKEGVVEFKASEKGLHYHSTSEEDSNIKHMLGNTVRDNFEGHTKHDVAKAKEARRLQGMVGNPTNREFKGLVREKLITNFPITVQDAENAVSLVLISPTLGGKQLGPSRNMYALNASRSLGILLNCTSM